MDVNKLQSSDLSKVKRYVKEKFESFKKGRLPKLFRDKKCVAYWKACDGMPENQKVIAFAYSFVFKDQFPTPVSPVFQETHKLEAGDWLEKQGKYRDKISGTLQRMQDWKANRDYEGGEDFFLEMQTAVGFLDDKLCDTTHFLAEHEEGWRAGLTSTHQTGPGSYEAEFDGLIGYKQSAGISFDAYHPNWGEVNAKLEESFIAGAWAKGGAKAKMEKLGFSAELQAAVAIGAQLDINGGCTWKKGRGALELAGECQLFAGAKVEASTKLSVHALKGIEAALKAGAFVGVSATVKGTCEFKYDGEKLVGVEAEASVSFGAGASVEMLIKAPLFGPTEIKFKADVALGLGTGTGVGVSINFSGIYLAGSQQFYKLVYIRTLSQGWSPELMTQDRKNLHYLDKCITRLGGEVVDTKEKIQSFQNIPEEKRSLLMSWD